MAPGKEREDQVHLMPASSVHTPAGELRAETDLISVPYLSDLDATWRFTDAHGHEHHCDYDGASHYPTLTEIFREPYWCGSCSETHDDIVDHYECRLCGETVTPAMTGPGVKYLSGPVAYYLDGQPITAEQASQVIQSLPVTGSGSPPGDQG
jgi:hypothetical protein